MPTINTDTMVPWEVYWSPTNQTTSGSVLGGDRDYSWPETRKSKPDRRGWRPPMGWSHVNTVGRSRRIQVNARVDFEWNGSPGHYMTVASAASSSGWLVAMPTFPNALISRAEVDALLHLKDQSFNLGVMWGEASKTAEHLTNTVTRLRRMVKAARRLDVRGALAAVGGAEKHRGIRSHRRYRNGPLDRELPFSDGRVSSLVLEHQYAWSPLLSDAKNVWDEFREKADDADHYLTTVFGFANEKWDTRVVRSFGGTTTGLLQGDFEHHTRGIHRCKVRLDYVLENPALAKAAAIGMTNPLEVGWELVPFSFVVDWFYPVGNYLATLDAALGYRFKGGTRSTTSKANHWARVKTETIKVASAYATKQKVSNGSPVTKYTQTNFNRFVYSSSPVPLVPRFNSRGLEAGNRFMNALALLSVAIKGK